ncbi:unnamed protein product [Prunus brigantina]
MCPACTLLTHPPQHQNLCLLATFHHSLLFHLHLHLFTIHRFPHTKRQRLPPHQEPPCRRDPQVQQPVGPTGRPPHLHRHALHRIIRRLPLVPALQNVAQQHPGAAHRLLPHVPVRLDVHVQRR